MKYKPNQRVAYYRVTAMSDPSPASNLEVGGILIDRPRGEITQWDFMKFDSGEEAGWITGVRLGFAKVDPATMKPVPEPSLQTILAGLKDPEGGTQ